MVDSDTINCKIKTYYNKEYDISIDKNYSFSQLKEILLQMDYNLKDIKFIYNGRLIRNDQAIISINLKFMEVVVQKTSNIIINYYERGVNYIYISIDNVIK